MKTVSGEWVFLGKIGDEPLTKGDLYSFWIKARNATGIPTDAQLCAYASHAVMNGENLHIAERLLGHRCTRSTDRYAHFNDTSLSQAAERVAVTIRRSAPAL